MHTFNNADEISDSQQENMLDDLEVRCQTNVAAVREATAHRIQVEVELRHGNISERDSVLATMQTSEISSTGLSGIGDKPLMVGSMFYMQFDPATLDVPPALAICDRCAMLSDSSFGLRFRFTQSIELAGI